MDRFPKEMPLYGFVSASTFVVEFVSFNSAPYKSISHISVQRPVVKPRYNDHTTRYFSVFWRSFEWLRTIQIKSRWQKVGKLITKQHQTTIKHLFRWTIDNQLYNRCRYWQVCNWSNTANALGISWIHNYTYHNKVAHKCNMTNM